MLTFHDFRVRKAELLEMARHGDIAKDPIKLDDEDWAFLKQFPQNVWTQALKARYHDDLVDALEDREARRKPIFDAAYEQLKDQIGEKQARIEAEKEAEKAVPHVQDPPEKEYTFKVTGGLTKTFLAKPNINRLVHKIETTRGQPHHPESGLSGVGKYGYDLWNVKRGKGHLPSSARGFQFISKDQSGERISDWHNFAGHRMYGRLPDEGEEVPGHGPVTWKKVENGSHSIGDTWTVDHERKELERKFKEELASMDDVGRQQMAQHFGVEIPQLKSVREIAAVAKKLANIELVRMAQRGELRGPPNPFHPEGQPVEVVDGKLKKMPLYLPHVQTTHKIKHEDGSTRDETALVPWLPKGKFLRPLTPDDDLPEDLKLGHKKNWVEMPRHFQGMNWLRGAAFHPMQNSTGRAYVDPSDPEFANKVEELEQGMERGRLNGANQWTPDPSGQYFDDVVEGIWQSIGNNQGGATSWESFWMAKFVPELHNIVMDRFKETLADERVYDPQGRRAMAKIVAQNYAQQDFGKGSRRKRGKKAEDLEARMKDAANSAEEACRAQGGRMRDAAVCSWHYDIRKLHKMAQEAAAEASQADTNQDHAAGLMDKIAAVRKARYALSGMAKNFNVHDGQIDGMIFRAMSGKPPTGQNINAAFQEVGNQISNFQKVETPPKAAEKPPAEKPPAAPQTVPMQSPPQQTPIAARQLSLLGDEPAQKKPAAGLMDHVASKKWTLLASHPKHITTLDPAHLKQAVADLTALGPKANKLDQLALRKYQQELTTRGIT